MSDRKPSLSALLQPVRIPARWIAALLLLAMLCMLYATLIEPRWIKVKKISISEAPRLTIAHISDIHYKGDKAYLRKAVKKINRQHPDMVCITGDLIETADMMPEALDILCEIDAPVYAIAGNHEYWARADLAMARRVIEKHGGTFLKETSIIDTNHNVNLLGGMRTNWHYSDHTMLGMTNIFLTHYPDQAMQLNGASYDLILAGHSHGGQVRLPFYGSIIKMKGAEHYHRGLYQTDSGPLYVNPGLGTYFFEARFMCRPEITIIRL